MDDVAPAEGRQGGIDPLQVLDDGRSHPDTVQVGDGIGGHGGLLVVSVMRPARRLAQRSGALRPWSIRSEEHTSELQSLMRISYAVFCLKKKKNQPTQTRQHYRQTITEPLLHSTYKIT